MGFRQADSEGRGGFARIWCSDNCGKYSTARVTTWKKAQDSTAENPIYETDFQDGYVRFISAAHTKIQELDLPTSEEYKDNRENEEWLRTHKGITIQIKNCDVQTHYDYKTQKTYINYVVYAFDIPDGNGGTKKSTAKKSTTKAKTKKAAVEDDDDDMPFE